jgi:hypothetical protein
MEKESGEDRDDEMTLAGYYLTRPSNEIERENVQVKINEIIARNHYYIYNIPYTVIYGD